MDTPGFDQPGFRHGKQSIEASDAFVFVVDSVVGMNEDMAKFFRGISQEYGQPKILVVFNKWDLVYEEGEGRADKVHEEYRTEARRFLRDVNSKNRYPSDENLDESIFFFSANHIKMTRYCSGTLMLREELFNASKEHQRLFICGGSSAGRSSIANLLMKNGLFTNDASGTSLTVSVEVSSSIEKSCIEVNSEVRKITDLAKLLKEEEINLTQEEDRVKVLFTKEDLHENWPSGLVMFDCPHCQGDGYVDRMRSLIGAHPCTLVIVVSAQHSVKNVKERIKKCLEPLQQCQGHRIILVVNKYDLMMDQYPTTHQREREKFVTVFADMCQAFQTREESNARVFYICLRHIDRQTKSLEQYQKFVTVLVSYGIDNFKLQRFDPIVEALTKCCKGVEDHLSKIVSNVNKEAAALKVTQSSLEEISVPNGTMEETAEVKKNRAEIDISIFKRSREKAIPIVTSMEEVRSFVMEFVKCLDDKCLKKEVSEMEKIFEQHPKMKQVAEEVCDKPFLPAQEEALQTVIMNATLTFEPESLYRRVIHCLNESGASILQGAIMFAQLGMLSASMGLMQDTSLLPFQRQSRMVLSGVCGASVGGILTLLYQCIGPSLMKKRQKALRQLLVDVHVFWRQSVRDARRQAILQKCYVRLTEVEKLEKDLRYRLEHLQTDVINKPREARS